MYSITEEHQRMMFEIEQAEGELTPEMEEALKINEGQLQSKSIAYLSVIRSKEAFNSTIDDEIKRLQRLKKQNVNLISRLKETLLGAVKTFGVFESDLHKFGTRKSTVVEVDDVKLLPVKLRVIKISETADKVALKKLMSNDEAIEGCRLVEKIHLKID